jgi:hypothetical protein
MPCAKKGFTFIVDTLIIAIIVGIILFYTAGRAGELIKEAQDRENCRVSALLKAKTQTWITDSPANLNCKTQFVNIREDSIQVNGKEVSNGDITADSVKRAFANQLYDCWYQFGAGTINPFWQQIATDNKHCVVCSQISFDDKATSKVGPILDDFATWLHENPIQENAAIESEKNTNYYDYLTRTSQIAHVVSSDMDFIADSDKIDMKKTYDVIYVAYIPSKFNPEELFTPISFINRIREMINYLTAGEKPNTPVMQVIVIDQEKIKSAGCSQLY